MTDADKLLARVAAWVRDIGYPIDFFSDTLPPEAFRPMIEDAWVRQDGGDPNDPELDDAIRRTVAEEGRWG